MTVSVHAWADTPAGAARRFTLTAGKARAVFSEWGATLLELWVPDRDGHVADVVLGHAEAATHLDNPGHLGAIVGRFANRIARGRAPIAGQVYALECNLPRAHLHGGRQGFHAQLFRGDVIADGIRFTRTAADGEAGYPGNLSVTITYTLHAQGSTIDLDVIVEAATDAPTLVSIASHAYFNLAGHDAGPVLDHEVRIDASRWLAVDADLVPTGELRPARGALDLSRFVRLEAPLSAGIAELEATRGFDHCYVIDGVPAAEVQHRPSGRRLEVFTDQPALQFYTAGHIDRLPGKGGARYGRHQGFCLETQAYPNAPNIAAFPSAELQPGERYRRHTRYAFTI